MEEVCSLVSKLERKSSKRKSQREKERMKKNQAATEKVKILIIKKSEFNSRGKSYQ